MTPADDRIAELLDKWLSSLDLHARYAELTEADYRAVQPWPAHDRPSKWIVELAREKTLELKVQHEARVAKGDARFAEALELMVFLANLVGIQNIERYIPLALAEREQPLPPRRAPPAAIPTPGPRKDKEKEKEKEKPAAATPAAGRLVGASVAMQKKIVADAVRLLRWGRQWHELAELIARIAERPPAAEIRRILRNHKQNIQGEAATDADAPAEKRR